MSEAPAFPPLPEPVAKRYPSFSIEAEWHYLEPDEQVRNARAEVVEGESVFTEEQTKEYAALHAADLQRQLEEARKDAQRLDWLDESEHAAQFVVNRWSVAGSKGLTLRDAIDAAMEQPK